MIPRSSIPWAIPLQTQSREHNCKIRTQPTALYDRGKLQRGKYISHKSFLNKENAFKWIFSPLLMALYCILHYTTREYYKHPFGHLSLIWANFTVQFNRLFKCLLILLYCTLLPNTEVYCFVLICWNGRPLSWTFLQYKGYMCFLKETAVMYCRSIRHSGFVSLINLTHRFIIKGQGSLD